MNGGSRVARPVSSFLALTLLFLSACAPNEPAAPASLWGPVIRFARAPQGDPPSLIVDPQKVTAGWIGADAAGIHQDVRQWQAGQLSATVVLPLPPIRPFQQQLFPGSDGSFHILWLDANSDGENRLFAALITADLRVERGPTPVSERHTLRYTAVSDGGGGLWVVWSGGVIAEPDLYAHHIDRAGRPRPAQRIAANADWPALVRANDAGLRLFWIRLADRQIVETVLREGQAELPAASGHRLDVARGSRLISFDAAPDSTHFYLFWNIVDSAGQSSAYMLTRRIDSTWIEPPEMVQIGQDMGDRFETGFNSGPAMMSHDEAAKTPLSWIRPMAGQFEVLAAAGQSQGQVMTLFFQNGRAAAYQAIAPAQYLLAPPALYTDQDRHLYLAWSEVRDDDSADLLMTTTRR